MSRARHSRSPREKEAGWGLGWGLDGSSRGLLGRVVRREGRVVRSGCRSGGMLSWLGIRMSFNSVTVCVYIYINELMRDEFYE
jgi:hypothetical protein